MPKRISDYLLIIFVVLASTFLLWIPFLLKATSWFTLKIPGSDIGYIYRNFDGLLYVIAAKTLYNPHLIENIGLEISLSNNYFAAHLPLYPILIRIFEPLFGQLSYIKSMISVNLAATVGAAVFFYYFLKKLKLSVNPFLLTIVFLFLPRFLVVRSIGAPESLFLLLVLGSLFFFEKKQYLLAGLLGAIATTSRTPGILLFVGYGLVLLEHYIKTKKINWKAWGILLIPVGLLAVFTLYYFTYGDFFAYFKSGDNIHLVFPYSVFNFQKVWVGTAWLEEILFLFFLYLLTVIQLKDSPYRSFFYFSLVFFIAIIFIQHQDVLRYSLPLWPMALIAFDKFFTSHKFQIAFLILLPAIYLYAWNFLVFNAQAVSNWAPYL